MSADNYTLTIGATMKLSNKFIKYTVFGISLALICVAVVYATFISNSIDIANNTVSTGQAALKLCHAESSELPAGQNGWVTSVTPYLNANNMAPGEERNLLGSQTILIGNDSGYLDALPAGDPCGHYGEPSSLSSTALKLTPTVSFTEESCPDPLATNIKVRFDVKGIDTGYKTLNSWKTNTTSVEPVFEIGQSGRLGIFSQLSTTATVQNGICNFAIHLVGKQPTT